LGFAKNGLKKKEISGEAGMDIAAWLQHLRLEQYEQAFREHDIDSEVLPQLTAEDLIGLGVSSIGNRRKLLAAIAALRDEPARSGEKTVSNAARDPKSSGAERRQLTVMFCDLVGSTALASRLDAEDLREVFGIYHKSVAETINRYDGFVAKYMGDGVLIYFGYPQAHEDDAERAVRAGLAVIDVVGRLAAQEQLRVRLGVASGVAVVGDLVGAGAAEERGVVGNTPNLAARLQALAEPNTLVIAEGTRRQIGAFFETEDLGLRQLAGFAEPQRVWRVVGESGVLSRFEALRSEMTPLIGRDEELDTLLRRWQQAKTGEGRAVLVSGEPGIGKSRLVSALSRRLERDQHTRLSYFCSPYHQDSALYPTIVQLERAAGFARSDAIEQKLDKLRGLLAPGARGDGEITLLAELLSLLSSAADLNLSPQRKREMLFEALLYQLESLARSRPVLMVFEDAHWIDPTSRELLDLTVNRISQLPVMLAVTFRPEFQHAWGDQPHVTVQALNRLGRRDSMMLVERLAGRDARGRNDLIPLRQKRGGHRTRGVVRQLVKRPIGMRLSGQGSAKLSDKMIDEIVERADGVPLFVEELTQAVLDIGDDDNRVAAVLAMNPPPNLAVPATLHAPLIARLDRLGPVAKEVAQIGAVIGREFGYDLMEKVTPRPAAELRLGLNRLAEAGLLFCRGVVPYSSYFFKHALVQDAAYGTLLRSRRQELHARVAVVLERHFVDLIERQPELLARHLTAAGDTGRAVDQWLKAGRHAAERLAHLEAIRHFDHSLTMLAALPEDPARNGREIELQLARGLSLFTTEGFISVEAAQAYARARELSEREGDRRQLVLADYGLWQSAVGSGDVPAGRRLSERLLQLTTCGADAGLRLQAHHSAWTTCMLAGEPLAAREHCEAGRRLYDPEAHRLHRLYGGHDPGVCADAIGALVLWLLGYSQSGLAMGNEGLALAERIGHPFSLEVALLYMAILHLDRGDPELALQRLDTAERLVAEQRLGFFVEPRFLRGAALTEQGVLEEAVSTLREGLAGRLGTMHYRSYGLARLAHALVLQGEHEAALSVVKEGLVVQERTGCHRWSAELNRLEGIALVGCKRFDEGQIAFERALRIARQQKAKAYELRAVTSLARIWGQQGRRAEARDLLAPVYGWFTEGFDTADLRQAKTLLDALG
jgi:class 3 adenylate cyclase/tetratricopeptide (TPR) repeat protein